MKVSELQRVLALANDFKEGDLGCGGTRDEAARAEARSRLGALSIGELTRRVLVEDGVSEALERSLDRQLAAEVAPLPLRRMKEILLGADGARWAQAYGPGLKSEVIAAVVKLMSNDELSRVARSIHHALPGGKAGDAVRIGSPGHLGSRIQPNSPGDDEEEILMSALEGLAYGCGDVIIGLNPASDDLDTVVRTERILQELVDRLELPTRYCVLSDLVKQSAARNRTRVDVGFQSLGGTSRSLTGMLGLDVDGLCELSRGFDGLYFETGQGAEVTNGAADGVDMVTLEARCYGLARHIRGVNGGTWMIVNDVAGFIGPEVFRTGGQLVRACLEDTVMAKLHGLTMGLDVCSTFHMGIDPFELQRLTREVVALAAPAYLMGVAGTSDPMLGYLTTSFREHPRLRDLTGCRITSAMEARLAALGVGTGSGPLGAPQTTAALYARFRKGGGDRRSMAALREEGARKLRGLKESGRDLGYGCGTGHADPPQVSSRLAALFAHARRALYATLDPAVIKDCCPQRVEVKTNSASREDYLAHPPSGELICPADVIRLRRLNEGRAPQVQVVVSDGLNADAVNENLREVLPRLRWELKDAGFHTAATDVVVTNGRVRAGYHAGEVREADAVVHLIGERPGTGLNQLSAYLTYGRRVDGELRWNPGMDHSLTNAICSIHTQGKAAAAAVEDIVACIRRMFSVKNSGVVLGKPEFVAGRRR